MAATAEDAKVFATTVFNAAHDAAATYFIPEANRPDLFQPVSIPPQHREARIRELAYYRWMDAGQPVTSGNEFWLQAKAEYEAAERLILGV